MENMALFAGKKKLCLDQYPSGRWGFFGSVPIELCEKGETYPFNWHSKRYETREEAIEDARSHGIEM